jgi:alkylated DNA repair protein (DNA oxidative demethylase)
MLPIIDHSALILPSSSQGSARDMMLDLFDNVAEADQGSLERLAPGAVILRGAASSRAAALLSAVEYVTAESPFRLMTTPGGYRMSVAMTNCGAAGWVTDRRGYRYDAIDPLSGHPWPAMPSVLMDLASATASAAGFGHFAPDACLVNRYEPGTRLSLHQDRNEKDFDAPIVSVSLGLPAVFLFGGAQRSDRPHRVLLRHGDVVVWGGSARLNFHGVMPLKEGNHPLLGRCRVNLTLRKAL